MITKLTLLNVASYTEPVNVIPTKVNYIYGANGSGKTTISRVISKPEQYPNCGIEWKSDQKLHTLVYNKDFVTENFRQDTKLKGIFTLGKTTPEIEAEIGLKKDAIEKSLNTISTFTSSLTSKRQEREDSFNAITEEVWGFKKQAEIVFREALTGFIKTKENFYNKCKGEQTNAEELLEYDILLEKYNSIYKQELTMVSSLPTFSYGQLIKLETANIFTQPIIGKTESQVSQLINHLQNSDWVNNGLGYLKLSQKKCPFCQQEISDSLCNEIESFFDFSYKEKQTELNTAVTSYINYVSDLLTVLETIAATELMIFSFVDIHRLIPLIKEVFSHNKLLLQEKVKSPSIPVTLKSIYDLFKEAENEIANATQKIDEHNKVVLNISSERTRIKALVWKYIANQSSKCIEEFLKKDSGNQRAIQALEKRISDEQIILNANNERLRVLEGQITSVDYTVKEINRILASFHFNSFTLAESDMKGHYKIIRPDKSDAKETLSEGEFTFITFLYFYQLIKGSFDNSGILTNKIVAIDDPISSLDSNILFIVSNLIKKLTKECKDDTGFIKQIFIMTHNIYFHKEVSFLGSRENPSNAESYWMVRKIFNRSQIKTGSKNQIQTTYELLWAEIRDSENLNSITIFNTLRRILEYYFKIIGNINYEAMIDEFEFEDKQACKALISWINDGSHFVNDDLLIDTELESMDRYLNVFRDIFEKLGHISHYNMMMKTNHALVQLGEIAT